MRVCPKCGYIDPPHWKHVKYSYWIDSCSLENFKILHPTLAKRLKKAGAIVEDKLYIYRLVRNGDWVERKAKIDFVGGGWSDLTEAHKPISPWAGDENFGDWHPTQKKLSKFTK